MQGLSVDVPIVLLEELTEGGGRFTNLHYVVQLSPLRALVLDELGALEGPGEQAGPRLPHGEVLLPEVREDEAGGGDRTCQGAEIENYPICPRLITPGDTDVV